MTGQPDIRMGIQLGDIGIQIQRGTVISVFVVHGFNNAGQVGIKSRLLTVADLPPQIGSTLAAAATEEKVVILLVIRRRLNAVKKRRRGPFDGYHNGAVCLIRIYVTSKPIVMPPKTRGIIELSIDILPVLGPRDLDVVVRRHLRKSQNSLSIRNIRTRHSVHAPFLR